ncbi:MAG: bifunctional folylpolyglutamate synthase/dihydrofolate synthase [Dysgonamonadaceae bacterium]|nr:bifunctional folylpolyglutamate synthase/dihydrofolate synthase [Dysgonamonadaceae bacterium]
MTYEETLTYLYQHAPMFQQIGADAYKEGLQNTLLIDERLDHPHQNFRSVHIAGTNGKGSTAHLLASILRESGYKTGLYTSPHLLDFRERIKINDEMIDKAFVIQFIESNKAFFSRIQPSFFELTTAMAFEWFAVNYVDVAIIEVGLGGRLDCTNIIQPALSIITNISLDHVAQLGNTLEAIAEEKAGIIKRRTPVVIGEANRQTRRIFSAAAARRNAPIIFAEDNPPFMTKILPAQKYRIPGWTFITKEYGRIFNPLIGLAQIKNTKTVLCAVDELKKSGFIIEGKRVVKGFEHVVRNTGLYGRWQTVQTQPKIVLDTGHNCGGFEYITRQLQSEVYDKLHIVIGFSKEKAYISILKLLPKEAVYYFTQASVSRALSAKALASEAQCLGLSGTAYPTVENALKAAQANAGTDDFIFVGGSNFVVADALLVLREIAPTPL